MRMSRRRLITVMSVLALTGTAGAGETARQILDRAKALDETTRSWSDRQQRMKLTTTDRAGATRIREVDVYERKYPGGEQKTILFFLAPPDVRGTGFLAVSHKGLPAEQWLYLPEFKRIRQITAGNRSESFVGTDLSYRDLDLLAAMVSWTEDDAASSLRGDETVDGVACRVIELVPRRTDIGYRRIVLWLSRDDLVPRKLELYAEGSTPTRVIRWSEVTAVGSIPVAHRIETETPATGTKSLIQIDQVKFNQNLEDELFSKRALERGGP